MKRICLLVVLFLFLVGCKSSPDKMEKITSFRSELLHGTGCTFTAQITADYGQKVYTFKMYCQSDNSGKISFEVISPESIEGITGSLSAEGGNLTFDDHALLFSMLADGRLSPVSSPWIMMRALRSGYISGCCEEAGGLVVHIDDSYQENSLQLIIRTDLSNRPKSAEIYYRGNRILTLLVEEFSIL